MVKTKLRCAGASDRGRVRHNNEDAFHMDAERGIFVVVDGIGGQAAGEKAAEIALGRVRARLERQTGTAEQRVREAITLANNEIFKAAQGNPEWRGMACVLTVAVLENGSAVVGHVGDSRLYQIRGATRFFATWGRKSTRPTTPISSRCSVFRLNPIAPSCCAATGSAIRSHRQRSVVRWSGTRAIPMPRSGS